MMQTIEVKKGLKIELDDLVIGLSKLDLQALTAFFEKLNQQMSFSEPQLSQPKQEILLLKQIKSIIPRSVVRRFKELQQKQYIQPLGMRKK